MNYNKGLSSDRQRFFETLGLDISPEHLGHPFFRRKVRPGFFRRIPRACSEEEYYDLASLSLTHFYETQGLPLVQGSSGFGIVHPFHDYLSFERNFDDVDSFFLYSRRLVSILRMLGDLSVNRIIFESADHYPFGTAFLVDQGLVDKVVVTYPSSGEPLDLNDLSDLSLGYLFLAGGYLEYCVAETIDCLQDEEVGIESICLPDLLCSFDPLRYGMDARDFLSNDAVMNSEEMVEFFRKQKEKK